MARPDKKQRQKAKREKKKKELRRRDSVSPVKRLAEAPGAVEVWMADALDTLGQAQIFVFKQAGGLSGVACFLVDRGVVGLKDAWVRIPTDRSELKEMIAASTDAGIRMEKSTPERARQLIAGGARWAHDNGMRLPAQWNRPAAILGGLDDWANADVSEFEMEFAGNPDDLRRRLIGEPLETFVQRKDILFTFDDSAPVKDQRTGEYLDAGDESDVGLDPESELRLLEVADRFQAVGFELADRTKDWLAADGEEPSAQLPVAWRDFMAAIVASADAKAEGGDDGMKAFAARMDALAARIDPDDQDAYDEAVEQVTEHMKADPAILAKGFAGDPGPSKKTAAGGTATDGDVTLDRP